MPASVATDTKWTPWPRAALIAAAYSVPAEGLAGFAPVFEDLAVEVLVLLVLLLLVLAAAFGVVAAAGITARADSGRRHREHGDGQGRVAAC